MEIKRSTIEDNFDKRATVEDVFHILGNRNRIAILAALGTNHSAQSFSDLKERLRLNPNTLAFHLDTLEGAGLVVHALAHGENRRYSKYSATPLAKSLMIKYDIELENARR